MTDHSGAGADRWWDDIEWWADPRLSYAMGLADGYAAGRADRDSEDDWVHRAAVKNAIRIIHAVDRRRASDRDGVPA